MVSIKKLYAGAPRGTAFRFGGAHGTARINAGLSWGAQTGLATRPRKRLSMPVNVMGLSGIVRELSRDAALVPDRFRGLTGGRRSPSIRQVCSLSDTLFRADERGGTAEPCGSMAAADYNCRFCETAVCRVVGCFCVFQKILVAVAVGANALALSP